MKSRFIAAAAAMLTILGSAATAQAQMYDPDGRFSGGQTSKRYEFFGGTSYGGSSIRRETVSAPGNHAPSTIIVNTTERRLYLVQDGGSAIRYGIGVGRIGFTWQGTTQVSMKKEWPDWTPPPEMLNPVMATEIGCSLATVCNPHADGVACSTANA